MDARQWYEQGQSRHARAVAGLEGQSRVIATARLLLAAAALALLGGIAWAHLGAVGWSALLAVGFAFVVLVFAHARVEDAKQRALEARRFHELGLARLDHAWERLPSPSDRWASREHPFAADLDIFGRASLMALVDGTSTRMGEDRLAGLLSLQAPERPVAAPGRWPDGALARQRAAQDLAQRPDFREALATAGGLLADAKPDPSSLLAWAEGAGKGDALGVLRAGLAWLAWLVPAAWVAAAMWVATLHRADSYLVLLALVAIVVGSAVARPLAPTLAAVSARESPAGRWRQMIAAIEREPLEAPLLAQLRGRLTAGSGSASEELAALTRIVGFLDARHNELFRFVIGPLLMWDVHCALALGRWRARAGGRVRGWLEVIGEVEALASVGGFAFENPEFTWPELCAEPRLEAQSLGHPMLAADRRVGNDVRLEGAGHALVVTGSNMSGKSTLLRAIGVNAVLAQVGAPVCARSMRIGPARVATSMRIDDSLEQGVSHFYAELKRLKRVIDLAHGACESGAPVLFLLDEILHGTNSRERVIGACAVVRDLLAAGALGAVSTHDLGITALERELGEGRVEGRDGRGPVLRIENVHFEEQVDGKAMTFDYRLRPGVVRSSNALALMRAIGIEVRDPGRSGD